MKKKYPNRDEVRKNSVVVPLSEIEKQQIREAATSLGMSMATYCRFRILRDPQHE